MLWPYASCYHTPTKVFDIETLTHFEESETEVTAGNAVPAVDGIAGKILLPRLSNVNFDPKKIMYRIFFSTSLSEFVPALSKLGG